MEPPAGLFQSMLILSEETVTQYDHRTLTRREALEGVLKLIVHHEVEGTIGRRRILIGRNEVSKPPLALRTDRRLE